MENTMTLEQRKRWEATRAKGKNRFLLLPTLFSALAVTAGANLHWLWKSDVALIGVRSILLDAGHLFCIAYPILCFTQMFRWKTKEAEYLSGSEQLRRDNSTSSEG
jgi:hypothetical protein